LRQRAAHSNAEVRRRGDAARAAALRRAAAAHIVRGMSEAEPSFYERIVALEREGAGFVIVTLVEARGSTPQDTGAKMIVTNAGRHAGTIGGGRVEARAIAQAQELLAQPAPAPMFVSWTLKGDVGMTCGGAVKLFFEPAAAGGAAWPIAIFGAGHIAQALVRVLLPLPCALTVCDTRAEWLEQLPRARNLRAIAHEEPATLVPTLPAHTFLLCMTKGHASDRPVLQRALAERDFPFIGVIGSEAKAAVLRRELVAAGLTPERAAQFHCPVGLDFGTNHPHEIALSIAAQLLTERDRRRAPR
jgi:xanthine dehydrogenase accessory factor